MNINYITSPILKRINSNKNLIIFLFFSIFLLFGIFIFPDYGISIDEDNTRIHGLLSLEYVFKIFLPEYTARIQEIIGLQKDAQVEALLHDTSSGIIATSGVVFDLPMAFLELIFQIDDSRQYYLLRHFFNFLFFFISVK